MNSSAPDIDGVRLRLSRAKRRANIAAGVVLILTTAAATVLALATNAQSWTVAGVAVSLCILCGGPIAAGLLLSCVPYRSERKILAVARATASSSPDPQSFLPGLAIVLLVLFISALAFALVIGAAWGFQG
ncbi:MAG: hypothetical protein IPP07_17840 [Holophagales bacterium]|jgi:hypothetical protein|nr:hypothetical protein [Holophagales bacterium]